MVSPVALCLSVCLLLLLGVAGVQGHPSGAPVNACQTLEPEHGLTSQTGHSPFKISVSPNLISQGQSVTVTLNGQGPFKGFVVQARDANSQQVVNGEFTVQPGAKTINCGAQGFANTATHSSAAAKGLTTLQWTAPQGFTGSLYFTGTIAETGRRYWSGLASPILTIQ